MDTNTTHFLSMEFFLDLMLACFSSILHFNFCLQHMKRLYRYMAKDATWMKLLSTALLHLLVKRLREYVDVDLQVLLHTIMYPLYGEIKLV